MRRLMSARTCSLKTLHQQNPPLLNWRCRLKQFDLYNDHKMLVVVVVVSVLAVVVTCFGALCAMFRGECVAESGGL